MLVLMRYARSEKGAAGYFTGRKEGHPQNLYSVYPVDSIGKLFSEATKAHCFTLVWIELCSREAAVGVKVARKTCGYPYS